MKTCLRRWPAIHAGDWLIKLLVMSVIIGMWAGRKEKLKASKISAEIVKEMNLRRYE